MGRVFSVKLASLAWVFSLFFCGAALKADNPPDGKELLRMARMTQGSQEWRLVGELRKGRTKYPFRLVLSGNSISYEFTDNGDIITLRMGDKTSTLEEKRGGKAGKVTPARFAEQVRGTDARYEDLSLRFLYWGDDARVIGDDRISGNSCWKVEVKPPTAKESQYAKAILWIGKEDGALMKAESYDAAGKWARRFTVRSIMKREGFWLLKQMRIESADGRFSDPEPTYLEIDDVEKKG